MNSFYCFLKDYCHYGINCTPFFLFILRFILSKSKNKLKKNLFTSLLVRIRQNNQRSLKDCLATRRIVKIFHCDVPDKMAASSKLSPHYYGMTVKSFNSCTHHPELFFYFLDMWCKSSHFWQKNNGLRNLNAVDGSYKKVLIFFISYRTKCFESYIWVFVISVVTGSIIKTFSISSVTYDIKTLKFSVSTSHGKAHIFKAISISRQAK